MLIRGAYGFTDGGSVEAVLWQGFTNAEAASGTQRNFLLRRFNDTPPVGIWGAEVQLTPFVTYTLKLDARAGAVSNSLFFIPSSRAFVDPVLTTAGGEPLQINFDPGTLTNNPNFVPPDIIPEPGALVLLLLGLAPSVRHRS